jgi:hypothetical protein
MPTADLALTDTLLLVPKFACMRWRPPWSYYDWKGSSKSGRETVCNPLIYSRIRSDQCRFESRVDYRFESRIESRVI